MGVTQKDIAQRLGISRTQVGAALTDDPEVAPATRQLVLATAREMGYSAYSNQSARSLMAQRYGTRAATGVVGYCGQYNEGPQRYGMHLYWAQLQGGVQEAIAAAGLATLLLGEDPMTIPLDKMDGLLSCSTPIAVQERLHRNTHWVSLLKPWPGIPSVLADDAMGIRLAVRHLVEIGHRRIGYLASDDGASWHHNSRVTAYHESLHTAGIEPVLRWVRHLRHPFQPETGYQGVGYVRMNEWLRDDWRELALTAMLVQNDQAAMGCIAALLEAGLRVPDDVSVVGFDGTEASECCTPRLTTVEVPLREIGARGADLLLRLLAGNSVSPEPVVLPVRLVVRESTSNWR